jgi:hypothetical protein
MSDQLELDVTSVSTKDDNVAIVEWKTIGSQDNFTVLGFGDDGHIYFWKNQAWNLL